MEQKYTAKQWAQLQGGHEMESSSPAMFGFVRDLNESSMYRTRQQLEATSSYDVATFAYINLVTLYMLFNTDETFDIAERYAGETIAYMNFSNYRQSATDLYQALHAITKTNSYNINEPRLVRALVLMSQGRDIPSVENFFMQLERSLNVKDSNYKSVRRIVTNWRSASNSQRRLVITRLLQYYRTNAIRSELYPLVKAIAKRDNLEIPGAENAEKKSHKLAKAAVGAAAFYGGYKLGRSLFSKI
jgi:hypothetical protein